MIRILSLLLPLTLLLTLGRASRAEDEAFLLRQLVLVNSGSENVAGVNRVQEMVRQELKKLGFQTSFLANARGENKSGKLLVGSLSGADPRFVTFVTHSDTVFEPSSGFDGFKVASDQDTVHGPGVNDDKGGLVVAISGITRYLRSHKPRYSLRFVVSPSEETGTEGFLETFKRFSKDSVMVLGFEPSVDGAIIDSRRGNRWYKIRITGKEAHGADRAGINACHELALKLVDIEKLGDPAKELTVSIGHMEGGKDKYNIVCGEASAKVDTRFADEAGGEKLRREIDAILARRILKTPDAKEAAVTTYEIADESPAFPVGNVSRPFVKAYLKLAQEIEKHPVESRLSVGSADTNYFFREGLILLDGLGPLGGHAHTREEWVSLSSLKTRGEALSRFLAYFDEAKLGAEGK